MKKIIYLCLLVCGMVSCGQTVKNQEITLKKAFDGKFYIGTALNVPQIMGMDTAAIRVVKENFNAIVAENCMKSGPVQPLEGKFDFEMADRFVKFGEDNGLFVTGHALIWHSQAPRWFFTDAQGNEVSREVLIERMKTHIHTVVGRYKGRVKGWDVVNEAIEDDGSFRKSKFYRIIGEDFIKLAFQFAHEADPDAELYYNDYSMAKPAKRDAVVAMVGKLKEQGVRIDAIGMQTHVSLIDPALDAYEKSLEAFAALGVKVMVTEMDVSVLPEPEFGGGAEISKNFAYREEMNPYATGLPDSLNTAFEQRCVDFFRIFLKHQDVVSRVTWWGVNDGDSWKNNWPIFGRTDYTLLFDRENKPKSAVKKVIDLAMESKKETKN